jgi:hypothetical protein
MACAEIDKGDLLVGNNAEFAKEVINRTPTADVVEVVRCKDCRHSEICPDTLLWCNEHERLIGYEEFCSRAERKEQT